MQTLNSDDGSDYGRYPLGPENEEVFEDDASRDNQSFVENDDSSISDDSMDSHLSQRSFEEKTYKEVHDKDQEERDIKDDEALLDKAVYDEESMNDAAISLMVMSTPGSTPTIKKRDSSLSSAPIPFSDADKGRTVIAVTNNAPSPNNDDGRVATKVTQESLPTNNEDATVTAEETNNAPSHNYDDAKNTNEGPPTNNVEEREKVALEKKFNELLALGVEKVSELCSNIRNSKDEAFIFICRCDQCLLEGLPKAKTIKFKKKFFRQYESGRFDRRQHLFLCKDGFVSYQHQFPSGHAARQQRHQIRQHLKKVNCLVMPPCAIGYPKATIIKKEFMDNKTRNEEVALPREITVKQRPTKKIKTEESSPKESNPRRSKYHDDSFHKKRKSILLLMDSLAQKIREFKGNDSIVKTLEISLELEAQAMEKLNKEEMESNELVQRQN